MIDNNEIKELLKNLKRREKRALKHQEELKAKHGDVKCHKPYKPKDSNQEDETYEPDWNYWAGYDMGTVSGRLMTYSNIIEKLENIIEGDDIEMDNIIKAIDKETGKWVYGQRLNTSSGIFIVDSYQISSDKKELVSNIIEIDPETICEYAYATDKFGKKIYKNDIVVSDLGDKFVVVFNSLNGFNLQNIKNITNVNELIKINPKIATHIFNLEKSDKNLTDLSVNDLNEMTK